MAEVILTLTLLIMAVISSVVDGHVDQAECSCGVFPENSSTPVIVQSLLLNRSCDVEGAGICQKLCIALAEGARDQAPALICAHLQTHVENLMVAVFSKISCNTEYEDAWISTGLKTPEPICCDEGINTVCKPQTNFASISEDTVEE